LCTNSDEPISAGVFGDRVHNQICTFTSSLR